MRKREIKGWNGRLEDAEKYSDIKYWSSQSDEVIFDAAWQMVSDAYARKGEDLRGKRLDKTVGGLRPITQKFV